MWMTDGNCTVKIVMKQWQGDDFSGGWSSDISNEFFESGLLKVVPDTDIHIVQDVDYCIDMANDWMNRTGDFADDDSTEERTVLIDGQESN